MIHSGLFSSSSVVSEREFNLKKKEDLKGERGEQGRMRGGNS